MFNYDPSREDLLNAARGSTIKSVSSLAEGFAGMFEVGNIDNLLDSDIAELFLATHG